MILGYSWWTEHLLGLRVESSIESKRLMDNLKPNTGAALAELRARVADFKKQAQLLLERFQRGEISQTEAQAEAARIEAEVSQSERRVHELELQHRDGSRMGFASGT